MFSSAVSVGIRLKAWKMKPIRSRRTWVSAFSLRGGELDVTDGHSAGCHRVEPAAQCISVDLPEPDGPMIAVNSPA